MPHSMNPSPSPDFDGTAAHLALVSTPPSAAARRTRFIAVVSVLALIVLGLAWELWLAPLREGGSWWALKVLPLLLPLPGLLRLRMYTYRWVSLLVWLYFLEGVVRATTEAGWSQALATIQVLLCMALFTACAMHIKLRLQAAKAMRDATAAQETAQAASASGAGVAEAGADDPGQRKGGPAGS